MSVEMPLKKVKGHGFFAIVSFVLLFVKIVIHLHLCFLPLSLLGAGDVAISCNRTSLAVLQGEKCWLRFSLRNGSAYTLSQADRFFISYHAYASSGRLVSFDNPRFALPQSVRPGQTIVFSIPVYFGLDAGEYRLEWDLVREGEFWGRDKNWQSCFVHLCLGPLVTNSFKNAWLPTFYESGRIWLDREQYLLRQVFKNNEIRKGGKFFGFSAGTTYPQYWIRDMATLMFYTRFFYPLTALQGMVSRFLERQKRDGEIQDWIDVEGGSDKNTVESDQESSLVLAAYELALSDPNWLSCLVAGMPLFSRLEMALEWVWQKRFDSAYGLIWSGFTADWGDVENSYPDVRAIKLSDRSRRTFSTYTQALFIQAGQRLVQMAGRLNRGSLVDKWRRRLDIITLNCRRRLYLPEQGYFLIHRLAGNDAYFALEKNILAVGGNAEAMRAGLLSAAEIERLLQVLENKKKLFGLRTVSFTLLPPYPAGFFPHPLLRSPWNYQNGGEWDWIGGRLVSALYRNGFREKAEKYLAEIVAKNLREYNIFEWSDKTGSGQGAHFYTGAAGVLGEAILHGHFGITEDFDRYIVPVAADHFKIVIANAGDRFTVENFAQLTVDIASLSKKEICLLSSASGKKLRATKKGKTIFPK